MIDQVKKIRPNRLEVVKGQMNPNWGRVEIPEEIVVNGVKDESCYFVVIVDRLHDSAKESYDTVVRIVKYRLEAFVSMKEHFKRAGIKNMFILHDPTIIPEVKEKEIISSDLSVGDAVEIINEVSSLEELELLVANDTRKGIIKATKERIEELKG